MWEQTLVWSWGTLVWPLRSVCWAPRVQVRVLPPYKELVNAVPQTVPHTTAQEVTIQARAGKCSPPPVWQGRAVLPSPRGDGSQCISPAQQVPSAQATAVRVSQSCCKTVHVLPGEKPPLPVLRPKEPCRDRAASGARTQRCRGDAALSTVELSVGPTLKEHTELWQWIPVGHPAPCPAGPAPAAINVGP